jgi:hypothetical protein
MPKTPVQLIKELFDVEQLNHETKVLDGGDIVEAGGRKFRIVREQFNVSIEITEGKSPNVSTQRVACDNEIQNVAQNFFSKAALAASLPAPVVQKAEKKATKKAAKKVAKKKAK